MRLAAAIACVVLAGVSYSGTRGDAQDAPVVSAVFQAKLVRAVNGWHREARKVRRLRRALRAARSKPEFIWWSTQDTHAVAEAVFDEQGIGEGERAFWRCVISRESGWRSDVWYGGAEGWHPEYAGTDRVNGLAQLRPYHADLVNDRVVSYATYLRTSDPVFAVRKALRLGPGPFFASAGSC